MTFQNTQNHAPKKLLGFFCAYIKELQIAVSNNSTASIKSKHNWKLRLKRLAIKDNLMLFNLSFSINLNAQHVNGMNHYDFEGFTLNILNRKRLLCRYWEALQYMKLFITFWQLKKELKSNKLIFRRQRVFTDGGSLT